MALAFADRYLLARFATGGVVVDLVSGNYFRINGSAALVCEALRATDRPGAEARLSRELGVPESEAAEMIADVIATLDRPAVHGEIQGSYHFYPSEGGYELRHGSRRVLEVRDGDGRIRLPPGEPLPSATQLELYVRALAPKLLFQRGVTVLHASACLAAERLLAFAGLSRAGKTTTARAFAAAGAGLVSEDLVVLSPGEDGAVLLEAEGLIQGWARRASAALMAQPEQPIGPPPVEEILSGATARLARILILDRSRRSGQEFTDRPLSEPDALIGLMTHDFLGAIGSPAWRRYFDAAIGLLRRTEVREASAPSGVDQLAPAAGRYTSSWTS